MTRLQGLGMYIVGVGGTCWVVVVAYSDDPSSNPAVAYIFSVTFVFKNNENKQKEAGVGTFKQYLPVVPQIATATKSNF